MSSEVGGVTDEWIELNGLLFHYRDWCGPGPDAPMLVILHNVTGLARGFDPIAEVLSAEYRVLVLDQRGHGDTQWAPDAAYAIDDFLGDFEAFVDALGLERFALLGYSLGGTVAMRYAGKRPATLDRLVVVDVGPEMPEAGHAMVRGVFAARDLFDSAEQAVAIALQRSPAAEPGALARRTRLNLMRTADGKWTRRWDRAMRRPSFAVPDLAGWEAFERIDVPTLLVWGEASPVLPRDVVERMTARNAHCRVLAFPGGTHAVLFEHPDAFLEAVRSFLAAP